MSDLTDELTKLASLRERGILTDAEFEAQKARLLGSAAPVPPPPMPPVAPSSSPPAGFLATSKGKIMAALGAALAAIVAMVAMSGGANHPDSDPMPATSPLPASQAAGDSPAVDGAVTLIRDDATGARYSAPGPRRCSPPNVSGPLTAQSAAAYVICSAEGEHNDYLYLLTQVRIDSISARPYNGSSDARDNVDPSLPVYDIAGSAVSYQCNPPGGYREVPTNQACKQIAMPHAQGLCYQEHGGNWQCLFLDVNSTPVGAPLTAAPSSDE